MRKYNTILPYNKHHQRHLNEKRKNYLNLSETFATFVCNITTPQHLYFIKT
jgi:hypothetical protein